MNHSTYTSCPANDLYRNLPSFSDLAAQARSDSHLHEPLNMNAHIHLPPNFSAFETVSQAVELADSQNVRVLGASNYYDYTAYDELASQCERHRIFPLFGTEVICLIDEMRDAGVKINDPGNPGKMYLCGKGTTRFSPMGQAAAELMDTIRRNDTQRMNQMIRRLSERFAIAGIDAALDEAAVKAMVVERHGSPLDTVYLQERHVAQAFQECLFAKIPADSRREVLTNLFCSAPKCSSDDAVGVQNEIRSHLMKASKPAFVPETFVGFDHAYRLILALGGIPCYPTLVDGASPICAYEADVDALIAATLARNIHCFELIPIRNSREQVIKYVTSMRQAGLIVTAGTEHNTRDVIPMAPTCVNGAPIPEGIQAIFREGAYVVAAHQYLSAIGRPGYVDSNGNLDGEYASDEERIEFLSELGSVIVNQVVEGRG